VNAEAFINKASFLVTNSRHEVLNLQYKVYLWNSDRFICTFRLPCFFMLFLFLFKVCYARVLDLKRKFLEAALRYYEISQIEQRQIGEE
jgi:COP9 signalosome complex subunit 4